MKLKAFFSLMIFSLKKKNRWRWHWTQHQCQATNMERNSGRIPRGLLGWERWWKLCLRTKRSLLSCSSWHLSWPHYRAVRKWVISTNFFLRYGHWTFCRPDLYQHRSTNFKNKANTCFIKDEMWNGTNPKEAGLLIADENDNLHWGHFIVCRHNLIHYIIRSS